MADLNFPQNPAPGDTYSIGTRTWIWNGSGWALQSGIISTNPFIVVSAQVTTTTNSTSTNSGAIIVAGGGGFGGNIYAADIYSNGQQVVTTGTIGSFGVSAVQAGTDTAVAFLPGNIALVWNTSTLETVTSRGAITPSAISITNSTASTGTSSGALTVAGGVGVGENLNVGGTIKGNFVDGYVVVTSAGGTLSTSTGLQYTGTDSRLTVGGQIYEVDNRVLTTVTPVAGTAISISSVSTGSGTTSFTVNNEGVTSAVGSTYIGISSQTGTVTFTNLGVQSLTGTTALGVSASTGTITLTNLGVTDVIGSTYVGVSASTGSITFTNLGVQSLTAGTGTAVSASTGTVTITSTDTLQSVTDRGAETNQVVRISNATGASTTTDGALVVTGGVGIGQNLWVGGTANIVGRTTFSDAVVFNGTATFVLSTNTVYTDNILELHTTSSNTVWEFDDGKDIGLRFHYYNRTLATGTNAALVLSNNAQFLEWYGAGAEGENTFTGSQYGTFRTGGIRLTSADANLATTASGALQVQGGVGIGGTQYIAGFGGTGNASTVSQQTLIVAANGIGIYGASHFANAVGLGDSLTVTGTAALNGQSTAASLSVTNNFTATGASTLNGSVTANSSVGVAGNFNVTGTSLLTGDTNVVGNLGVTTNFNVTGTSTLIGITRITSTVNSAGTDSGALIVSGGGGFGGNLNVGGDIFVAGVINATVVGSISTATHIAGGATGAIPYQTAFGRTSFINPGPAGTILTANGTGVQPSYQSTLTLAGDTQALSTLSGALVVLGGAGIGKDLYVGGDLYINGDQAVTTGTIGGIANLTIITAGTDTAISTSTGNITIWNTSTLASVTDRGGITPTALVLTNATQSTSTDSGALVVIGGVGVGQNLWVGGDMNVAGNITAGTNSIFGNTGTFGNLVLNGPGTTLSIANNMTVGGNITATNINVTNQATVQNLRATITTTTSLLVVQNAGIDGNFNVTGTSILTGDVTAGNINTTGAVYVGATLGVQGALSTTATVHVGTDLGVAGNVNVTGTTTLVGGTHSVGNLGVTGDFSVTGTTTLSSITATVINVISTATFVGEVKVGPASQYTSYESTTATTTATISLDSFASTEYRTVKYLVQVTDTGATPNKVHVAEFLVFHDNNGVSTQAYVIQYGIGSNTGELGTWDAVYSTGIITLQFTPNYVPTALTVKTVRTAITV